MGMKKKTYRDLRKRLPEGHTPILAAQVPIDYSWLNDCLSGYPNPKTGLRYKPSVRVAKRVEELTLGKIKWHEFFEDI